MGATDDNIKHIVLLMLENHSFDQMLGALKEFNSDVEGVDRNNPKVNFNNVKVSIPQSETRETQMVNDPFHETADVNKQLNVDELDGFVTNFQEHHSSAKEDEQRAIMGYYPLNSLPALHELAKNFAICDHWFSSLPGPTWPNRFFALTGTSNGKVKMPENKKDFGMLVSQTQDTIFDRLNEKGCSWNVFYYDFPCSLILKRQQESGKAKHYKKIDNFFDLCKEEKPDFPQFSLIEPKFNGFDQNDDHPPHNVMKAQKLIADVYNAIRTNDFLWESTLLVVLYDEHGGFYDHVVPPAAVPPEDLTPGHEYTFDRLGVRVPAILISKWVAPGVVKTVFDHTSLLRYVIDKWKLAPLTKRVSGANSIEDVIKNVKRETSPGSIRVSFSQLASKHPEWELSDLSNHHTSIIAFLEDAVTNELGKHGGVQAETSVLRFLNSVAVNFSESKSFATTKFRSFKAWLGARLVRIGHNLIRSQAEHREQLIEKVTSKFLGQ